jgi:hypothetical protein
MIDLDQEDQIGLSRFALVLLLVSVPFLVGCVVGYGIVFTK